jgi:hypothetical protein
MMTMMEWMKYSSTHLRMCLRMNSQINVFVSANQQNLLHETPEIEFKLGMNIIFKDETEKSEHVDYKRATARGLKHVIRRIDGSQYNADQNHLSLINQIRFENISQTSLNYCQEVGIGITQEQAQQLAFSRALTPQQQELMSWHHCLHHLPFNRILMLEKRGCYLTKILLNYRISCLYVLHVNLALLIDVHGALREKKWLNSKTGANKTG